MKASSFSHHFNIFLFLSVVLSGCVLLIYKRVCPDISKNLDTVLKKAIQLLHLDTQSEKTIIKMLTLMSLFDKTSFKGFLRKMKLDFFLKFPCSLLIGTVVLGSNNVSFFSISAHLWVYKLKQLLHLDQFKACLNQQAAFHQHHGIRMPKATRLFQLN